MRNFHSDAVKNSEYGEVGHTKRHLLQLSEEGARSENCLHVNKRYKAIERWEFQRV